MKRWRSFRQAYLRILKGPELEEIPDLLVFRPLAYLGVRLIAPTGITPNQVTAGAMFLGVLGGWLIARAGQRPELLLWGAGVVFLSNTLDCMDGMLARLRGTFSRFGHVLDGLGDYVSVVAIMLGIAYYVASQHDKPAEWWFLAAAAGVTLGWWSAVVDGMRAEWQRIVHGDRRERAAEVAELIDEADAWKRAGTHRWNRVLVACYVFYVRLWGLGSPAAGGAVVDRDPPAGPWAALNRPILRLALLGGPTVQLTAIIAATAFDRLEWFLWATVIFGNAWAAMVLLMRAGARRRLAAMAMEEA